MKINKRLILASKSPRRYELLSKITEDFSVIVSDADENVENADIEDIPLILSKRKAQAVFSDHRDAVVIGADTVVVCDRKVLGKPEDENDAKRMLKILSGKRHKVITGCTVISPEKEVSFSAVTEVKFYDLSDEDIMAYISTGEPFDKAGAYGIQGAGYFLVEYIYGDYNNVVGLPVSRLKRELEGFFQ